MLLYFTGGANVQAVLTQLNDSRIFCRVFCLAIGHHGNGRPLDHPLTFPSLAAGVACSPSSYAQFLVHVVNAFHQTGGAGGVSHATARAALSPQVEQGSKAFIGASTGLGFFLRRAGPNHIALHHGANDGFRSCFVVCYDGPDQGKGYLLSSNTEAAATGLFGALLRELMVADDWAGLALRPSWQLPVHFSCAGIEHFNVLNMALKTQVFDHLLDHDHEEMLETLLEHETDIGSCL